MAAKPPHEWAVHVGAQDKPERIDVLDLIAMIRQDWWAEAACRGKFGVMFPDRRKVGAPKAIAKALELCQSCAVRAECAAAGLSESYGIWGGHLREPHSHRRMTVGRCLSDGRWWTTAELALTTGRSEAHVHAQMKKLGHHWPVEMRQDDQGRIEYRREPT